MDEPDFLYFSSDSYRHLLYINHTNNDLVSDRKNPACLLSLLNAIFNIYACFGTGYALLWA